MERFYKGGRSNASDEKLFSYKKFVNTGSINSKNKISDADAIKIYNLNKLKHSNVKLERLANELGVPFVSLNAETDRSMFKKWEKSRNELFPNRNKKHNKRISKASKKPEVPEKNYETEIEPEM